MYFTFSDSIVVNFIRGPTAMTRVQYDKFNERKHGHKRTVL